MSRKTKAVAVIAALVILVLAASVHQVRAEPRFAVASWEFPSDEYGQGIYAWRPYENSTGSWLPATDDWIHFDDPSVVTWNASVGIKLSVECVFNNTFMGAEDLDDGVNYIRFNVTVFDSWSHLLFSQDDVPVGGYQILYGSMWMYTYNVVFGFIPAYGFIYTATVTYELLY